MSDATSQTLYFYNRHRISCDIILAKIKASRGHLDGLRQKIYIHTIRIIMAASQRQMNWREAHKSALDGEWPISVQVLAAPCVTLLANMELMSLVLN